MIDIESQVFTAVADAVKDEWPNIYVTGEYVGVPPNFPCVSVMEIDKSVYGKTSDSGNLENHAEVTYEIEIYSNLESGRKSECKNIASLVDSTMSKMGFIRTMLQPIPNYVNASIYRMVGRYRAIVSANEVIYRR